MKIAFYHYYPLELFPPAINMINYLGSRANGQVVIHVYTTTPSGDIKLFDPAQGTRVKIHRIGRNNPRQLFLFRYLSYIWYYLSAFFHSFFVKPTHLFYVETMSAPVPLFLKRWIYPRLPLFIHYHELMRNEEYDNWPMAGAIHRRESAMYSKAAWVSHTNEDRLGMFKEDQGITDPGFPGRIMPNFPSVNWTQGMVKKGFAGGDPLRLVYIGAVDLVNICFGEFIDWLELQEGRYILDIWSNQDPSAVADYARKKGSKYICFKGSIPYLELPSVLVGYDVGLILYRGNSDNFMYNAPNKLFEYLAVGLDVWFPSHLRGIQPYQRTDSHPMVIPMDIFQMEHFRVDDLYTKAGTSFRLPDHFAENVYSALYLAMAGEKIEAV